MIRVAILLTLLPLAALPLDSGAAGIQVLGRRFTVPGERQRSRRPSRERPAHSSPALGFSTMSRSGVRPPATRVVALRDVVLQARLRDVALRQTFATVFLRDAGAMFGEGDLWIGARPDRFGLSAINLPERPPGPTGRGRAP